MYILLNCDMAVFLDYQCFQDRASSTIVTEFAIMSLDGLRFEHVLYKTPYTKRQTTTKEQPNDAASSSVPFNNYQDFNYQNDTNTNCAKIMQALKSLDNGVVYVKGLKKNKVFQNMMEKEVINLDDFGCPSFSDLKRNKQLQHRCFYHSSDANACMVETLI